MKILSLNLWFNNESKLERTKICINYIKKQDPDIVFFQEATASVLAYIYQNVNKLYPYVHTSVNNTNYGLAILSKSKMNSKEYYK